MTVGKITTKPANKKAIFGYTFVSLIFFGIGILCFILLWNTLVPNTSDTFGEVISDLLTTVVALIIAGGTIQQYWWVILLIVVGLMVVGFLVGWLLLFLVKKFGHILVYAGIAVYIIGAVVGILLAIPFGGVLIALISLVPVVFLIIGMFTNIRKFKRAGEFMKFTGEVVLAEKGMILAPLFVSWVSVINFLTMGSIFAYLVAIFYETSFVWAGYLVASIASLLQLIVYYGSFYIAESINTTYAYEWYRKRDPDMKFCVRNVAGQFGPIFAFGAITAIVSWIQQMLRNAATTSQSKGNVAGLVLAILARAIAAIVGFVFKYLTYFTLPAITVEGLNFRSGVTRSFNLLKKYYMDVLIRETGVQRAMAIVQWIAFFIYGILGAIVGLIVKAAVPSLSWTTAMLICIIPMVIFANIPTFFIFRPMKTAYLTFVFAYAQDEESGFNLPTRMPANLRSDLKDARKTLDPSKSIVGIVK